MKTIKELENELNITELRMLEYCQIMLDMFKEEEKYYNEKPSEFNKERYENALRKAIACKDMAESVIGQPVNLQKDGVVRIGF